ncbi:hypothetical protein CDG77_02725 [Nostoc sp. 'Peltigera membranacea cyanobiont' 213]|uniref:hypothetical protein n=1 Tax=unclassified Nostoc TaxID=2593658 RepID=UPI000B953A6C|nr:hypothetical protein [Nostoc sp. 'Peltigera membranacea cyanobiont' 213]OYD99197.1 hypothetical protein CDG77_02725 [Nostoc sp. 'Peltigera membranacea cyanobiont' 213]
MPVFRKDIDFFFEKFIKVSTGGGGDASVWAVGSYQGIFILTVIEKKVDSLTIDDIVDKPAFFMLDDLMKFSPEWQYDSTALALSAKLAISSL